MQPRRSSQALIRSSAPSLYWYFMAAHPLAGTGELSGRCQKFPVLGGRPAWAPRKSSATPRTSALAFLQAGWPVQTRVPAVAHHGALSALCPDKLATFLYRKETQEGTSGQASPALSQRSCLARSEAAQPDAVAIAQIAVVIDRLGCHGETVLRGACLSQALPWSSSQR